MRRTQAQLFVKPMNKWLINHNPRDKEIKSSSNKNNKIP